MDLERGEFRTVLKSFETAMLVSKTGDGRLHARPIALAEAGEDGELWFVTAADADKAREIRKDDHVSVTCQGPARYLSVSGRISPVEDRTRKVELWKESWRLWFPDGPDDPALVLLRVRAETAEYWDHRSARGLKYAFAAAKAYVTRRPVREGTRDPHGKLVFV